MIPPLKPAELAILLALAEKDLHGYGIAARIAEGDLGSVRLSPGNLYPYLNRLMKRDMILEGSYRAVPDGRGKRRRYYRLSAAGRRAVAGEMERLRRLIETGERLGLASQEGGH